jgi:rare lipoprotein A
MVNKSGSHNFVDLAIDPASASRGSDDLQTGRRVEARAVARTANGRGRILAGFASTGLVEGSHIVATDASANATRALRAHRRQEVTMPTLFHIAATAALYLLVSATSAAADGWHDNTAYRNTGWSYGSGLLRARSSREDAAPARRVSRQRGSEVAVATDEDRPQRRSRGSRAASIDSGSMGSGGGTTGMASFYWQPQRVASGGWFNPNALTAAHKTLPFGTRVRVTHLGNGRSVDVTINDRGPYIAGRIIDLSKRAAGSINMTGQGVARIRMTVLGR